MIQKLKPYFHYIEAALIYSLLFFVLWSWLPTSVIPSLFIFAGIIFALFYGMTGMIIASMGLLIAVLKIHEFVLGQITPESGLISVMGLLIFLVVGNQKEASERDMKVLREANDMGQKRIGDLVSQLVSIDISHKKFLGDVYFRVDRPTYLYHEMRKTIRHAVDEMELFSQIFSLLYRYTFVEGGIVYKRQEDGIHYKALFRYGASVFPEAIDINDAPDWFKILQTERQIIFPKILENHQFIISIPIMTGRRVEDVVQHIIVVERIRYSMMTSEILLGLKIIALILRFFLEKRLYLESMREYSLFEDVLVFKPDIATNILRERIDLFERAQLPYKLAYVSIVGLTSELLETLAKQLHASTREFDEKFVIGEMFLILFSFAEEIGPVIQRLQGISPAENLKEIEDEELKQFISTGHFMSLDHQ